MSGEDYKVQVSFKYGQTMINLRGETVAEVEAQLSDFTGESFGDMYLSDTVMQVTELFHKGEREAGIFEERSYGNRGGGGNAGRGGAAGVGGGGQGVPANQVKYEGSLPAPQGSSGENCACGVPLVMGWSTPSTKPGPNYGKSWPIWQCQNNKRDHGVWPGRS